MKESVPRRAGAENNTWGAAGAGARGAVGALKTARGGSANSRGRPTHDAHIIFS